MQLFSTNNPDHLVDLKRATMEGLAPDKGLYLPTTIPTLPASFWETLKDKDFTTHAYELASTLLQGAIPEEALKEIIEEAINFPAPIVSLEPGMDVLELFHGPSLAFKDFGARFMSRVMSYYNRGESDPLTILVATSGDTGGAVAAGFFDTPGIEVIILYPKGKVSPLQELQLTTWGGNISAIEVDGVFDDCQDLVKQAFLDPDLKEAYRLSSANSINICRLIPQAFYYVEAYRQLNLKGAPLYFVVPSGNFGNLTAGLIAYKMGLPVAGFVAATNANDVVPRYFKTGAYSPSQTIPTISNAMDVGAPSNFVRLQTILGSTWNTIKEVLSGYAFSDASTREAMRTIHQQYGYIMDPHGALGYLAAQKIKSKNKKAHTVILETAHPTKFLKEVEQTLGTTLEVPKRLAELKDKESLKVSMDASYSSFKSYLLKAI